MEDIHKVVKDITFVVSPVDDRLPATPTLNNWGVSIKVGHEPPNSNHVRHRGYCPHNPSILRTTFTLGLHLFWFPIMERVVCSQIPVLLSLPQVVNGHMTCKSKAVPCKIPSMGVIVGGCCESVGHGPPYRDYGRGYFC